MNRRLRIALWTRIVLLALYLVGIVVQFIAAGYGFFEGNFDFHEGLGWTVMHLIPLLILVATLVLWWGGTQLWLALAIGALGIAQPILAAEGSWAGVIHPLVALVLFILSQALVQRDLASVRAASPPVDERSALA